MNEQAKTGSARFTFVCGRFVVNQLEHLLRSLAIEHDVDLELEIRKGWIECFVYAKATGTESAIRAWHRDVVRAIAAYRARAGLADE